MRRFRVALSVNGSGFLCLIEIVDNNSHVKVLLSVIFRNKVEINKVNRKDQFRESHTKENRF